LVSQNYATEVEAPKPKPKRKKKQEFVEGSE